MHFYYSCLTNTMHIFYLSCYFNFFGLKLILMPPFYRLLIANIYNFLNLDCSDTLNSKNIKINNFLNSNCPKVVNLNIANKSKNIKICNFSNPKCPGDFNPKNIKLARCFQFKKYKIK